MWPAKAAFEIRQRIAQMLELNVGMDLWVLEWFILGAEVWIDRTTVPLLVGNEMEELAEAEAGLCAESHRLFPGGHRGTRCPAFVVLPSQEMKKAADGPFGGIADDLDDESFGTVVTEKPLALPTIVVARTESLFAVVMHPRRVGEGLLEEAVVCEEPFEDRGAT